MKRIVLEAPGRLVCDEVSEPAPPGPGEALVQVLRVGVCGTDLHAYRGKQPFIRYPIVLGHELAVEVLALASEPSSAGAARVGDRCTVFPYLADGTCVACHGGKPNCCEALELLGVHVDGGLRERFVLPAHLLIPVHDLDPDVAALVEMLAVGAHAARRAAAAAEERVLVLGAGPIGLSVAAFVRRSAGEVLLFDVDVDRAAFARELGLGRVVETPGADTEGLVEAVRAAADGELPHVVVDATGHPASMERAPHLARHGGRVVFVGHTAGALTFDNPTLHRRELTFVFSRNALRADFDEVLAALRDGEIDVGAWITTRSPAAELVERLPVWTGGGGGVVKAVASWEPPAPPIPVRRPRAVGEQESR